MPPVTYTRLEGTILAFVNEAPIRPYRLATLGAQDGSVKQAAAATDFPLGVFKWRGGDKLYSHTGPIAPSTSQFDPVPVANQVDVVLSDIAEVEYGATVTRGQALTTDANGRAIPAATGNLVYGYAMVSGVVNDIGNILIDRGVKS